MQKFTCLRFFIFFLCIIHLNYNTVNKLNVFRLKFPLILQLSDTITVLRNIDTHTHTFVLCEVYSAAQSLVASQIAVILSPRWIKRLFGLENGGNKNLPVEYIRTYKERRNSPVSLYGVIPFNFKYNIHHFLWFSFLPTKWTIAENLTVPLNIPLFILLTRANSNYLLTHCNGFWNFSQALQAVYCYC